MSARAAEPFHFYSRLSLTLLTGRKARSLAELVENLREVPESVVYQHTHRFLQMHQHLVPEPANDFASWVSYALQDEELGERVASVDTVRHNSLAELRRALVKALEPGLQSASAARLVPPDYEFHFMGAVRFSVPTGRTAWDLAEFARGLREVSIASLYLHVFEARLRPPLGVNDFSLWFERQLGEKDLAQKLSALDPYTHTLEGLRAKILMLVERRIQESADA